MILHAIDIHYVFRFGEEKNNITQSWIYILLQTVYAGHNISEITNTKS